MGEGAQRIASALAGKAEAGPIGRQGSVGCSRSLRLESLMFTGHCSAEPQGAYLGSQALHPERNVESVGTAQLPCCHRGRVSWLTGFGRRLAMLRQTGQLSFKFLTTSKSGAGS